MSKIRARICKPFKEPRNRFPAWRSGTTNRLSYRAARQHRLAKSIPWNRFLASLKVYEFGLRKRKYWKRMMVVDREKCVWRGATMMIIITNTHADWPAKYEPAHWGQLEHLSLLFSLSKERKVFEHKYSAKGIVQPFELGGETRLIRSAVKY